MGSVESFKQKIAVYIRLVVPPTYYRIRLTMLHRHLLDSMLGIFLLIFFYYFDTSTKRQASLKEFCFLRSGVLKFGATRWLCKEECINRVLKQYPSLKSYFSSQPPSRSDTRLRRLQMYFSDSLTEIYLLFLQSMQSQEPKIHILLPKIHGFLRKLLGRFVTMDALCGMDITQINSDDSEICLPPEKVMKLDH